ncbi:bifunctional aspartate kinase/homoserine dehydrogenase I [Pinibacter soli]|uniref:Bifunctional aspartate kinase/homoserine dehydrogenase I n=1 Tax=Pinibacter soli TaxID=3044211 RepID=A0ABT6RBU6_9BACT|nr:bifunctional aspartate kinase/homoserine dehydrogenase I [Pinibacter soli]MDI3319866.1 bifunctional aspartate kinase/homoserine dehydrogenase I [Pinibacter soli]
MQVLKFGGSSVANAVNIQKVISIVLQAGKQDSTIVVVSALGGITDTLLDCGAKAANGDEGYKEVLQKIETRHLETVKSLIPVTQQSSILSLVKKTCNELEDVCTGVFLLGELSSRTKDKIVSFGELLSSQIIAHAFQQHTFCTWKDSRELIVTDDNFGSAKVDFEETNNRVHKFFNSKDSLSKLFVTPGFISSNKHGAGTTLGRGGSDYTAAIFAAALSADALQIWTDVSGMMTADPRLVANAKNIPHISYQEAMELSHFGAKVIYPPTIQPVMTKQIPTWVKNTFAPDDFGTLIETAPLENGSLIRGISSMNNIALLSLEGSGMIGIPGFSKRLFEALSNEKINVILITQSSSEHSISVALNTFDADKAKEAVDRQFDYEIKLRVLEPVTVEKDLAIVAVVGDHMRSHPGISGKMFGTLGRNGVSVRAIAQGSSERNISAVIAAKDVRKAINVLHEDFFETTYKQINLFIAGTGNVGGKLLAQLQQQADFLQEHLRVQLKVAGLATSKKMLVRSEGIDLGNWQELLSEGEKSNLQQFVDQIKNNNLRNSIFVDITANETVATVYDQLLQSSVSVVACNKIACSSRYQNYKKLKDLAREYNVSFLFETNVGAGLPVIGTLNDLRRSGDTIKKIEAVLSGTLNFVFNNYDGSRPFAEVVKQAQDEGYTEPDPRLDLSGTDVMRKIMILARESGEKIEMEDISNDVFLPASCMDGDVPAFYEELKKHEAHFKKLYDDAAAKKCKLKFVAKFENGKASVGLQHINEQHDLYHLYGKDNIVLFYTNRYPSQPLIVKGAGAGAEVTASGVFADILRAV